MSGLGHAVAWLLCRTVGCTGPLSRWFMWPHRYICTPLMNWRIKRGGA